MKTLEERVQRERERNEIVKRAVEAADRIIMDGSDGSVEETDHLTSEVAQRFNEKVNQSVYAKLARKDMA
jgi:phosphoheptose isomerase